MSGGLEVWASDISPGLEGWASDISKNRRGGNESQEL
jgi:hypothetical protein